ncbi:hypothetical protein [Xanthocytophaga agilis]|uniref:Uncharacterized protein n=1 Tax=Xanthocytophaga agilis TaxID=3048010 RepID=A0AAE3R2Y0_9BACT|nr:hypothetical protein [Xanthocytophaga agilis]MDJ1500637.1 hypothetical protein [Xanthocytophaga agilis]
MKYSESIDYLQPTKKYLDHQPRYFPQTKIKCLILNVRKIMKKDWLFFSIAEEKEDGTTAILNWYCDKTHAFLGAHSLYLEFVLNILLTIGPEFDKLQFISKYLERNTNIDIEVEYV